MELNLEKFKDLMLFPGGGVIRSPLTSLLKFNEGSSHEGGHIFNARKDVYYELNKPLEVGDIVTAWGVYKDHTTSKFSVNIKGSGPNSVYLLHVDFRPFNDVVVLNNYEEGWKTEVRPVFSKNNFAEEKMFEVRIEVHEEGYRIFFNGNELNSRFPHRVDLSFAKHVILNGGSNGFKWTALKLPSSQLKVPGVLLATSTEDRKYFDKPLAPGDIITARGIYASGSSKFSINLMMESGQDFMIHVDFRPPPSENKVVLNSKTQRGWETELRTALPVFENGKAFKVDIKCLYGEFEIYHGDKVLGSRFPYRNGFALGEVQFIWLLGGNQGMVWTDCAVTHGSLDPSHFEQQLIGTRFDEQKPLYLKEFEDLKNNNVDNMELDSRVNLFNDTKNLIDRLHSELEMDIKELGERQEREGEELQKLQTTKNDLMSKLEETKKAHNALDAEIEKCQVECEEVNADLNRIKDEEHKLYLRQMKVIEYAMAVQEYQNNPWKWWNPTVLIPSYSDVETLVDVVANPQRIKDKHSELVKKGDELSSLEQKLSEQTEMLNHLTHEEMTLHGDIWKKSLVIKQTGITLTKCSNISVKFHHILNDTSLLGGDVSGKGARATEKGARFKKIFDRVFNHALETLGSAE